MPCAAAMSRNHITSPTLVTRVAGRRVASARTRRNHVGLLCTGDEKSDKAAGGEGGVGQGEARLRAVHAARLPPNARGPPRPVHPARATRCGRRRPGRAAPHRRAAAPDRVFRRDRCAGASLHSVRHNPPAHRPSASDEPAPLSVARDRATIGAPDAHCCRDGPAARCRSSPQKIQSRSHSMRLRQTSLPSRR